MPHCHGSPAEFIQAACGDVGPHDGHDCTEADEVCPGSAFEFIEADCGRVGPHGKHPLHQAPTTTIDGEVIE